MSAPELTPDDLMAAEYVLGLLEGEQLLEARARISREREFANSVAWWEAKLAPLLDNFGGAAPGQELWARIEATLPQEQDLDEGDVVALRRKLRYWQATAGLAMAASLAALVFALLPLMRAPADPAVTAPSPSFDAITPPLFAEVPIGDGGQRLAVMWLPERGELLITAAGLAGDGVHDHELWLLPDDGTPRSLGLVRPGGVARLALSPEVATLIHDGARVALSREPLGGKPPTAALGPVVAQGTFTRT